MISSLKLAEICGVSQGTVDRALHARKGINEETRRKIIDAAKKYGFSPNPSARELMTGKSSTVGGVISSFNSIFFMDIFERIRLLLRKKGLTLVIVPVSTPEETVSVLRDFASRRYLGAIVVPPEDRMKIPGEITRSLKMISIVNPCSGSRIVNIFPDEVSTGFTGTRFLWEKGHRRILFLSYTRQSKAVSDRKKGYEKFMKSKTIPYESLSPVTEESLIRCIGSFRPTAVFCHNDWLALSAIRILERNRYKVPSDISVLGVDNSPTFISLIPELSTVEYPIDDVAEMVFENLAAGKAGNRREFSPLKVIDRKTVSTI
ncbi:MAG TPA: hypothetical protein DET40_05950 [Lentisphaeria bacterium]|nr:MAG: hypothetical protein A2X45_04455 [Lentisphaerae bacterium GWF2_50_93]HCE43070.1 hypothetical protein [Lentisphaeria bacterium]